MHSAEASDHRPKGDKVLPRRIYELTEFVTSEEDLFVLNHLGEPAIGPEAWRLTVDGLIDKPQTFSFDELDRFPKAELTAFHKCAGSPHHPSDPTPDRIGNVIWSGFRLADLLHEVKLRDAAKFIWSFGKDHGSYGGSDPQNYCKDLPLGRALASETLLATHLNGRKLTARRGGPLRLVAPGYYGTNSVKWLTSLHVADSRAPGVFTTRFYNDQVRTEDDSIRSVPVWAVAPDSAIASPRPGSAISRGAVLAVSGWAWGDAEITAIHISLDGGSSWHAAEVAPRIGYSWQAFQLQVNGLRPGRYRLLSRASDRAGLSQPAGGARNASVPVDVTVAE